MLSMIFHDLVRRVQVLVSNQLVNTTFTAHCYGHCTDYYVILHLTHRFTKSTKYRIATKSLSLSGNHSRRSQKNLSPAIHISMIFQDQGLIPVLSTPGKCDIYIIPGLSRTCTNRVTSLGVTRCGSPFMATGAFVAAGITASDFTSRP